MTEMCVFCSRHDQCRGLTPSGAWIPDAGTTGLPRPALRHHARVLAQRPDEAAHVRDPPMAARRLLHPVRLRVQRSVRLLTIVGRLWAATTATTTTTKMTT